MQKNILLNKLIAASVLIRDSSALAWDEFGDADAAALIMLDNRDTMNVGDLSVMTGLTHSATVRLVDRLCERKLLRRQGRMGRQVFVAATAMGRRRAQSLLRDREAALLELLAGLTKTQREAMGEGLDVLLGNAVSEPAVAERICRHCDHGVCKGARCPVKAKRKMLEA